MHYFLYKNKQSPSIIAGHSIFAHSRPDKIGTPRLLPLYIRNILNGISAKKSAQILYPAVTEVEMSITTNFILTMSDAFEYKINAYAWNLFTIRIFTCSYFYYGRNCFWHWSPTYRYDLPAKKA